MIRHLFKLIWNKKKQNFLLITEILISFMVIFAVFSLMIFYYNNYKKPLGFEYENVWSINFNNPQHFSTYDSVTAYYESVKREVKGMSQVKEVSYVSGNYPFSGNTSSYGFKHKDKEVKNVNSYAVEPGYKNLLTLNLLEGRWFEKQDEVPKKNHIVINKNLRDEVFGKGKAVGELLGSSEYPKIVIGVVDGIKQRGDYYDAGLSSFNLKDTSVDYTWRVMLIKVSPDADAAFEGKLYKKMAGMIKNSNIEIQHLDNKRRNSNYFALVPIITTSIVACFLIINVALGLFGVLWYNISRRRGEIGIRRAVGASGAGVSGQLVGESMILATLALIVGSFFAIQFPLLHVFDLDANVYLLALLFSILFIYLLVLLCSLYPGRQAAGVYPAVALHED